MVFCFGSLTKPDILRHILDLEEEPQFRPAKIVGYELASWGQYPALVDNIDGAEVIGYAYLVQTGNKRQCWRATRQMRTRNIAARLSSPTKKIQKRSMGHFHARWGR